MAGRAWEFSPHPRPARPEALPDGPQGGRLATTVQYHRDPLGTLREARREHGEAFSVTMLTTGPMVVVADRSLATELAASDPVRSHAGEARRRILPQASPASVFGGDGTRHHVASRRIARAFSAPAVAARTEEIRRIAAARVRTWPRDRPTRLLPRVRRITDEIFVRVVLGVHDEARVAAFVEAIARLSWTPGNPPVTVPARDEGAMGALVDAVFRHRLARLRRLVGEELAVRRALGETGGDDIFACLLREDPAIARDEVADELAVVLLAGQEPPAIALTRLLDRAGRSTAADRALRGLDGPGLQTDTARETLRLHPPASGLLRRLTVPLPLPDRTLPAGTDVLVSLALLHRDPAVFPAPDRFDPGRFGALAPASYLPFGDGARRCIGEHLAWAEIRHALPAILGAVEVHPLARRPERAVVRGTVLVPVRSGLAVLRDR